MSRAIMSRAAKVVQGVRLTGHCARVAALAAALALLGGCASQPPKPAPWRAQLVASQDLNPDASGRPSPVVVRVFQLRGDGEFAGAEFFALYASEKETLGASLLGREEFVLEPGEQRELVLDLDAQTRYLGALAAFRDIRSARWRALIPAPERRLSDVLRKDFVTIAVGADSVTIAVQD